MILLVCEIGIFSYLPLFIYNKFNLFYVILLHVGAVAVHGIAGIWGSKIIKIFKKNK